MASPLPFSDNVTRKVVLVGSVLANEGFSVLQNNMVTRPFKQKWIVNQTAEFRAIKAPGAPGGILTFNADELGPPDPRRLDKWTSNKSLYTYPDNFFISDREELLGDFQDTDYKQILGTHVEAIQMAFKKRAWYDVTIRELDDSDYNGELQLMKLVDTNLAEQGFTAETSKELLLGLWPGELMKQIKKVIVHRDIWLKLYSIALQTNNAGIDTKWVTKNASARELYVHGVPCEMDDVQDTTSTLDEDAYVFKGLKYVSDPGDSEADPVVPPTYRYRAIAVLAPLVHHGVFLPSMKWSHERGKPQSEVDSTLWPKGKPSGWNLDYEYVYVSYLDAPFRTGANRVGMAYLDFEDLVGEGP